MLVEPLLIVGTVFVLFAFCAVISRLDAEKLLKASASVKNA